MPASPDRLFETSHRSPLLTLGEDVWLPVPRLSTHAPRTSHPPGTMQPPFFALEEVGA